MDNKVNNFTPFSRDDLFHFESTFDTPGAQVWMKENWTMSFWYCLAYVILVFAGRQYMSKRPKYEVRIPLIIWSSVLAVFSICGAVRTLPELIFMLRVNGLEGSMCDPSVFYGPTAFWSYVFAISKLHELGDTAFIVLRKQPLIFLHWYHHVTVFIYTWYSYAYHTAPGRWFVAMNFSVHSFMYTYYALRAMRIRLPKFISIVITTLQISQMMMGIFTVVKAYQYKSQGHFCQQSWDNMQYCGIMYASYLILFARFFFNAYLRPKRTEEKLKSGHKSAEYVNGKESNGTTMNGNAGNTDISTVYGNGKKID